RSAHSRSAGGRRPSGSDTTMTRVSTPAAGSIPRRWVRSSWSASCPMTVAWLSCRPPTIDASAMGPGTGSKPTADVRRGPLRARWVATAIGTAIVVAFLLVVIAPRAGEVGDALGRVGPGRFVATAAQQVAAETVSFVVEAALVSLLILAASWTLGIPLWAALLIVVAGVLGVTAMIVVAQRWTAPRFSAGLAVAREPRSLASLTAALAATLLAQMGRVGLALSSVGLHSSPIVVIAVFVASGASAVIPIGTAAAGATAPLLAAA